MLPDYSLGETQELELKQALPKASKIAEIATGFANISGGSILFGVDDQGSVVGVHSNLDKVQIDISSAIQTISPVPRYSVEVVPVQGCTVVHVRVFKAMDRVFHTHDGIIWVRNGSTTRRLDGQAQLDFLRERQLLSFDEAVCHEAGIADLDLEKITLYLGSRNQSHYLEAHTVDDFLLSQHLAIRGSDGLQLKNATVLLFAKNPVHYYPQIEVKIVRFEDEEAVGIVSHELIQADLPQVIERAFAFIKSQLPKSIVIRDLKREEHFEYPLTIIREAIVNAVTHRDYDSRDSIQISLFSNRIEIVNPGGLPRGLTPDMFGRLSVQRNALLYRILRDMNYIEGLGTGIPRMKNAMRKAGLRDPEFVYDSYFFRVIFYNDAGTKGPIETHQDLNVRQQRALVYLQGHPMMKAATYQALVGVSHPTVMADLRELISYGIIAQIGVRRGTYYVLKQGART